MIGVVLYVLVVSVFVSAGGWFAERILASLGWPRRWAWSAAMLLTVAIPAWHLPGALPDMSPVQVNVNVPRVAAHVPLTHQRVRHSRQALAAAHAIDAGAAPGRLGARPAHRLWTPAAYQRVLLAFLVTWALSASVLLGRLLAGAAALRRQARDWADAVLDGVALKVSEEVGPAVIGFVHPRIVVPHWLPEQSAQMRSAVLVHESEHLSARDGHVLLGARLLVALIPWNLPLWWLWRRLRLAIEIDCDARAVRRGVTAAAYGEELLAIATRLPAAPRPAVGLFERRSQLAQRIRILLRRPRKWWRWAAVPLYALTGMAALAAGTFPAPPVSAALGARNQTEQTARQMDVARIRDARLTRRLVASARPYALAAAAVLGWPYPESLRMSHDRVGMVRGPANAAQRLGWLARAVSEAPAQPDLLTLEKNACQSWDPHCDVASFDARLRALDPRNGLAGLDGLETSLKAGDPAGIDAALAALGQASYVDTYTNHLFAQMAEALHGTGKEGFVIAFGQLYSIRGGGTQFLNAMIAFSRVCNWKPDALSARRLALCRSAVVPLEHGDTIAVVETGLEIAMRLWPAGMPQYQRAAMLRRHIRYLIRQSARLLWPPDGWQRVVLVLDPRGYFERMYARNVRLDERYPREQDVLREELIEAGLRVNPPSRAQDR